MVKAFSLMVHTYLQCSACFWSPEFKKDGSGLEQAWVRAANVIQGNKSLSYKQRNRAWCFFGLLKQGLRRDMTVFSEGPQRSWDGMGGIMGKGNAVA